MWCSPARTKEPSREAERTQELLHDLRDQNSSCFEELARLRADHNALVSSVESLKTDRGDTQPQTTLNEDFIAKQIEAAIAPLLAWIQAMQKQQLEPRLVELEQQEQQKLQEIEQRLVHLEEQEHEQQPGRQDQDQDHDDEHDQEQSGVLSRAELNEV